MLRSTRFAMVIAAASGLLLASTAGADDLNAPSYRGAPLSVEAHWQFSSPVNFGGGLTADSWNSVAGSGNETLAEIYPHLDWSNPDDWQYNSALEGIEAITANAGFAIYMPNWDDLEPLKRLRVQIAYSGTAPSVTGGVGVENAGEPDEYTMPAEFVDGMPGSNYFYEDWQFVPNPDWEQMAVAAPVGTVVTEVDVDTVSVPEPGTLGLLALGGLALLRRRRKS